MKTYAPSSTNRLAVANPMPVEPPVITAVLSLRSAMITPSLVLDCRVKNFRSRAAFFTVDEDGHAWAFLGGHLLNGPARPCNGPRTLTTGICGGVFDATTMRPFPALATSMGWLPTSPGHGITGLLSLVVDDARVSTGLAAGSRAIAAAGAFGLRHASTRHR